MASVPQSSWFCTVRPSNVSLYSTKANPRNLPFKTLKVSSSSSNAEPSPSISSNPPENSSAVEPSKSDRLKLAFDKAKEYKESLKSNPTPKIVPNPVSEYAVTGSENGEPIDGVPLSVRIAMEKGKGYKENKDVVVGSSGIAEKGEAFSGTKKDGFVSEVKTVDNQELPPSVKLAKKAKEFQNKGVMSSGEGAEDIRTNSEGDFPDVEILVGDPSKYGTTAASKPKSVGDDNKPKVSTWGTAPSPRNLSKTEGNFPEVDILVGDTTKFGAVRASEPKTIEEDDPGVHKPKVSTSGDSPSRRNISKAQGDFPEVEILVGDPRKFRKTAASEPESIDEYKPKVSTHGASPSSRNISKTEGDIPEVEILVGDPSKFGTATVSKPKSTEEDDLDVYRPKVSTWGASPSPTNISETEGDFPEVEVLVRAPSKFGKAAVSNSKSIEKVYKPKGSTSGDSPSPRNMSHTEEDDFPEVEMLVGDPRKLGTTTVSEPNTTEEDNREVFKPKVSTLDASPSPRKISKMEGHFSEAEILVGKPTKFGTVTMSEPKTVEEDDPDIYKPNVSTWGVFPRPRNISKAYGGGRVIRPGEVLETAEVKAAKDVRTRELVAAYRRKTESSIDPKLKSECEEALKDGDSLMDIGKLKEALPFYETVMYKIPFESELHGLAALHWAICQDSLTRHKEARVMYGKLKSHPNVNVKKTAKQFFFSFQAMAMLKVKSTTLDPINLGYQKYFDAFVEDKANYPLKDAEVEEGALKQALPYFIFLASPIVIVLLIALQKRI